MAKPVQTTEWATGGGASVTEPSGGKKAVGWVKEKMPFQWLNWILRQIEYWLLWLSSYGVGTDIAGQSFARNAGLLFDAGNDWGSEGIRALSWDRRNQALLNDYGNALAQADQRGGSLSTAPPTTGPDSGALSDMVDDDWSSYAEWLAETQVYVKVTIALTDADGDWQPFLSLRAMLQAERNNIDEVRVYADDGGGFVLVSTTDPVTTYGDVPPVIALTSFSGYPAIVDLRFEIVFSVATDVKITQLGLIGANQPVSAAFPRWQDHNGKLNTDGTNWMTDDLPIRQAAATDNKYFQVQNSAGVDVAAAGYIGNPAANPGATLYNQLASKRLTVKDSPDADSDLQLQLGSLIHNVLYGNSPGLEDGNFFRRLSCGGTGATIATTAFGPTQTLPAGSAWLALHVWACISSSAVTNYNLGYQDVGGATITAYASQNAKFAPSAGAVALSVMGWHAFRVSGAGPDASIQALATRIADGITIDNAEFVFIRIE